LKKIQTNHKEIKVGPLMVYVLQQARIIRQDDQTEILVPQRTGHLQLELLQFVAQAAAALLQQQSPEVAVEHFIEYRPRAAAAAAATTAAAAAATATTAAATQQHRSNNNKVLRPPGGGQLRKGRGW